MNQECHAAPVGLGTQWDWMHTGKAVFTCLTLCGHLPFALSLGGDSPASPHALFVRQTLTSGQWEVPRGRGGGGGGPWAFFLLCFFFLCFRISILILLIRTYCGSSTSSAPLHLGNGKDLTIIILGRPHYTSSFWPILPIHPQHIILG